MKHFYILFLLLLSVLTAQAQPKKTGIDWPVFMQRQTLRWDSISTDPATGMLLGNGLLRLNIYQADGQSIRFDIGRSDLDAQQPSAGYMLLKTAGKIKDVKLQLNIYDARARGTIYTTKGSITFGAFVHAGKQVIYTSAAGLQQEKNINWQFVPAPGKTPGIRKKQGLYAIFQQSLPNKGAYAAVWKSTFGPKGSTLLISLGYDPEARQDGLLQGINALKSFNADKLAAEFTAHINWWHQFYQQRFLSLPDQRMESFYWMQVYQEKSLFNRDLAVSVSKEQSAEAEVDYLSGLKSELQGLSASDDEERRDSIRQSLELWLSQKGKVQREAYPVLAAIYATIGEGNKSYALLNELFDQGQQPEASAASAMQEMLLQSWGGKIRIFPAIPEQWKDLSFDKLSTADAFLVSAQRTEGKTTYIKVYSSKGGPCRIESDMQVNRVSSDKTDSPALTMSQHEGKTNVLIQTVPGESLWLSGIENNPGGVAVVKPVIHEEWTWGLKKKSLLPK